MFAKLDISYILERYFDLFDWKEIFFYWISAPLIVSLLFSFTTISQGTYTTLLTVFSIAAAFIFNANVIFLNSRDSYLDRGYINEKGEFVQYTDGGDPGRKGRVALLKQSLLYLTMTTLLFFLVIALLLITRSLQAEIPILDFFYKSSSVKSIEVIATISKIVTLHFIVVVVFNIIFVLKNLYDLFKGAIDGKISKMR